VGDRQADVRNFTFPDSSESGIIQDLIRIFLTVLHWAVEISLEHNNDDDDDGNESFINANLRTKLNPLGKWREECEKQLVLRAGGRTSI